MPRPSSNSPASSAPVPEPAEAGSPRLRVATYNIHKGVRGVGPVRRLEIHNLVRGVAALQADVVMLQEVQLFHHRQARHFGHRAAPSPASLQGSPHGLPRAPSHGLLDAPAHLGWPEQGQAEFLAPEGYDVAYRTNAVTRHGEHGNALLARWPLGDVGHRDVSHHRFEQRGLLHVPIAWQGRTVHGVVAHFGLIHASRVRQVELLGHFIADHVPPDEPLIVGGDFNDWRDRLDAPMATIGLRRSAAALTFPSRVPVFALDRFYTRGWHCVSVQVPRGPAWSRMSDHLPLVAEFVLSPTESESGAGEGVSEGAP